MKTIMITAPSSNSGKTLVTLGIIRALKNRNIDISGFKSGGDFIDLKYISKACGKRAGNLDRHLLGDLGIKNSLAMNKGEIGIIEGAMGYFDGIGNGFTNSSYDISCLLDINSILIYTPKGEMFTSVPKIKGMVEFSQNRIKGIILNKVSKNMYLLLKERIEEFIDIKVLGFMEKDKDLGLGDSPLGLALTDTSPKTEELIEKIADKVEKNIDLESILDLCKKIKIPEYSFLNKSNIKVSIAYDKAFNFYYNENLKLLEDSCLIEYFSPLKDKEIPKCDFLYIGGGYPELFKKELTANVNMVKSIKDFIEEGGFAYAEAGGMMYLGKSIDGCPMCGILDVESFIKDSLERFGYINIRLKDNCILGRKGHVLSGNEFHKSISKGKSKNIFSISKVMGHRNWECAYKYKNLLAAYPHVNFLGNMGAFEYLLNSIKENSQEVN